MTRNLTFSAHNVESRSWKSSFSFAMGLVQPAVDLVAQLPRDNGALFHGNLQPELDVGVLGPLWVHVPAEAPTRASACRSFGEGGHGMTLPRSLLQAENAGDP